MTVRKISPADKKSDQTGSFSREVLQVGGLYFGSWRGYALLKAGSVYSSLDITIPSEQRGIANTTGLLIEPASYITSLRIKPLGALTMGAIAGKIKLAASLTASSQPLYVESSSGLVIPAGFLAEQFNPPASWTISNNAAVTYKLFATDGAAGAAAAASTVTAAVDTKILVVVSFVSHAPFPSNLEFGVAAPSNT
jgi:hypothetical protein